MLCIVNHCGWQANEERVMYILHSKYISRIIFYSSFDHVHGGLSSSRSRITSESSLKMNTIEVLKSSRGNSMIYFSGYTGCFINISRIRNLNISARCWPIELKFLPVIEDYLKFFFMRETLKTTSVNYHFWLEYRNLIFNVMVWTIFWKYFSFNFDF